ncbi:SIR2 family protein [Enterococcus hirae]|uniref:SIR2 family protein n=1 Tax=Enterococcus hirae TaxID=1354 RepID=UPI002DBF9B80|nr:SIR2 family protein [Enterococcus hirae]MEB7406494.1 SIR2 family protein [Enterococcus hirae]
MAGEVEVWGDSQEEIKRNKYFKSANLELSKSEDGKYFKNDGELRDDDNKMYTEGQFNHLIQNEVMSFVDNTYDNIVLLAGAGASVVTDENGDINPNFGKTMSMIAENIAIELGDICNLAGQDLLDKLVGSSQYFKLQELADLIKYEVKVTKLIDNGKTSFNWEFNLEDFLSNLITYEQFLSDDKEKFIRTKNKILDLIKENTNYSFDIENMNHAKILKILSQKVKKPNKLSIITTNYDTLFEEAAEMIGFTVLDGFTFSYNPYFDSDIFEWNFVKDIPNVKTNELEYKKNVVNLLKIHGSLTWEKAKKGNRIRRKIKTNVDVPIMVFPSSNKYMQSYEEPYFELFTKFQELLKRPNTLLITTGFSFADNHIAKMVTQAIKSNAGLAVLISDYNIDQAHPNWEELDVLKSTHYRIAFLKATLNDNLTNYLGENYVD